MNSDSDDDSEEEEFDRRKQAACAVVMAACMAIIPVIRGVSDREEEHTGDHGSSESIPPDIARDSKRERYIRKILRSTDRTCIDMTRMSKASFDRLCRVLKSRNLLRDTLYVSVEEQLIMFLNAVGHGMSNRIISRKFARSGETVSRYFNIVLKAIGSLKDEYIRGVLSSPPPEFTSDPRYWPWFKDCIGVIGRAHFPASVPAENRSRINGQELPVQNFLAAVNFNLTFSFVLACWESQADDSKILREAMERENGLPVPEGKYYLVDKPCVCGPCFISPYQDHQDGDGNPPTCAKELFNRRHASLRARMEHAMGVLKTRFRFLTSSPQFSLQTQVDIIMVCCILHNMIIEFDPTDEILLGFLGREYSKQHELPSADGEGDEGDVNDLCDLRDGIAEKMWRNFMIQG